MRSVRLLAQLAFVGQALFAVLIVTLTFLRPDLAPGRHFVSEYALGPWGSLMDTAFVALAVGGLALAASLRSAARLGLAPLPGARLALLVVWAAGTLAAGVWKTDPVDTPRALVTVHGLIHNLAAGLAFLAILLAMLTISPTWRGHPAWRALTPWGLGAGVLGVATFAWFVSPLLPGLGQRATLTLALGWLLTVAARVLWVATRHQRRESP